MAAHTPSAEMSAVPDFPDLTAVLAEIKLGDRIRFDVERHIMLGVIMRNADALLAAARDDAETFLYMIGAVETYRDDLRLLLEFSEYALARLHAVVSATHPELH